MSIKRPALALVFIVLLAGVSFAQQWRPVSGSRQSNISGMVLIDHDKERSSFLIVHDNKKKDQVHAAILTVAGSDAPTNTSLKWVGDDIPVDLEAVSAIPGVPNQFMLFTAAGRVYHVKLDSKSSQLEAIKSFDIPSIPQAADFESFALQRIDNILVAVWADRGLTDRPATLFAARFDLASESFSDVRSTTFRVPYPAINVRHISDINVDASGGVFLTSASDPGNDGPFSSAMYFAGVISQKDKSFVFTQSKELAPLFRFDYHKIEAFDFVPGANGGLAFGTDDENLGSSVLLTY